LVMVSTSADSCRSVPFRAVSGRPLTVASVATSATPVWLDPAEAPKPPKAPEGRSSGARTSSHIEFTPAYRPPTQRGAGLRCAAAHVVPRTTVQCRARGQLLRLHAVR